MRLEFLFFPLWTSLVDQPFGFQFSKNLAMDTSAPK